MSRAVFVLNPGNGYYEFNYAIQTPWTMWQQISIFHRQVSDIFQLGNVQDSQDFSETWNR